jgi:hypothetical protein
MPKVAPVKPKSCTHVSQPVYEAPTLFPAYRVEALNIEERKQLRNFMATPLYGKLIRNAYCKKPGSVAVPLPQWNEHASQISINRLHQIQGWEMFEAAFFGQAEERVAPTRKMPEENFQTP